MRDMPLEKVVKSWKIVDVLTAGLQDSLAKNLEKKPFYVIELLNPIKQSEHLAIISQSGAIYEQNWPDWQMRLGLSLEKIMEEYKNLFGCAYYNIYAVPQDRQKKYRRFPGLYAKLTTSWGGRLFFFACFSIAIFVSVSIYVVGTLIKEFLDYRKITI